MNLLINDKPVKMETNVEFNGLSLMSQETFTTLFSGNDLQSSTSKLRTHSGKLIPVFGDVNVDVCYGEQRERLPLVVYKGAGPSLLGQDWMSVIRLDWKTINVNAKNELEFVLPWARLHVDYTGPVQGKSFLYSYMMFPINGRKSFQRQKQLLEKPNKY